MLGTNTQKCDVHLMIKMKMTLTDDEGHRQNSNVTRRELKGHISQTITLIDIIPGAKVKYNKRNLMTSAFLTLTKGQGHT